MYHNKIEEPIYFDNAATSYPKPQSVVDATVFYMQKIGCNINRGSYGGAVETENVIFDTRQALTDLFNGDDCKNTIFTANVTSSLNILLKGLLHNGDHVLVSSLEHNAVMRPLQQLRANGITFDRIPCDIYGNLELEQLPLLCKKNTKAIIVTHASNVCGTLLPLDIIGEFCKSRGLYFIVDSAQTAGVFKIDMKKQNIDALAFTGHKGLLGPQGIGGFLIKEHMISKMEPLLSGGTGSLSHTEEIPSFMPDRFEPGTLNLPGIYGLSAGINYLKDIGMDNILKHELDLTMEFLNGLKSIKNIKIFGASDIKNRAPVVSIQINGIELAEVAYRLDSEFGIQTRVGLHCAPIAHHTLGTYPTGTIRFSFGHKNTSEEVQRCIRALEEICYGV